MTAAGQVGRFAYLLGFAGLLPQAAVLALAVLQPGSAVAWLGFAYGALILSFLGGIWWSIALRRPAGQARLLVPAVLPSLVPLPLAFWGARMLDFTRPLVALGVVLMLTLLVDRALVRTGEVPAGWMRLRVPLSLGLGLLSILIAVVDR